jgi:DNA repair protein RadD
VSAPTLRDYQVRLIADLRSRIGAGIRKLLACAGTGTGKTLCMAEMTRLAVEKGKSVAILSPRRELVYQTSRTLESLGVEHGIIMAGEPHMALSRVKVICVPTLHARAVRREKIMFPSADVVLVDEAHLSIAPTTLDVIQRFNGAVVCGFTATPARGDGRGLGTLYQEIIHAPRVAEMISLGWLVPVRYFTPPAFDVNGVPIVKGDYSQKQLGEKVDNKTLVGDVVTNWLRIGQGRKTIVFGVTQAHAKHIQEAFIAAGIRACYVDSETDTADRTQTLKRFQDGEFQILCNVGIVSYGYDAPTASCIVLARPTKSIVLYFQSVGRGLRPSEGKKDCIVIDHGGVVENLGFIDEPVDWTLDGNQNIGRAHETKVKQASKGIKCQACDYRFLYATSCPNCGAPIPEKKGKPMKTVDADLVELTKTQKRLNRQWDEHQKRYFFGELRTYARQKGYSDGWAAHKYKTKLGVWPNAVKDAPQVEISAETHSWIRAMNIRWAMAKNKGAAHAR